MVRLKANLLNSDTSYSMAAHIFILTSLLCSIQIGQARKVVLLDTTESPTELKWNTYSTTGGSENGWLEETYSSLQGSDSLNAGGNYRAYVVCEVDKQNVDNWLRTPFVERGNANRLYIEITFTMRDCTKFPHTARTCKETFTLLYRETDHTLEEDDRSAWSAESYNLLDRIAADAGRFTSNNQANALNTETRSIPVGKKGVFFAFRDEGACTSIVAVKIYYEVCEETIAQFAWFPETPTGSEMTSIIEAQGHCLDAASAVSGDRPSFLCKADGTWDRLRGGCQCNVGYWPEGNDVCVACDPGSFKDFPGLGRCQACPENSNSRNPASETCECEAGYYRASTDPKSAPCTQPPDRPMNAKAMVNQDEAIITWSAPSRTGGRSEVWYRVVCQSCPSSTQYSPGNRDRLNRTEIRLKGLIPDSIYSVLIYAENDVSQQLHQSMYTVIEVKVPRLSPFLVQNFRVSSSSETQMTLSWDAPEFPIDYYEQQTASSVPLLGIGDQKSQDNRIPGTFRRPEGNGRNANVHRYEIRYYPRDKPANSSVVQTADTELKIDGLRQDRIYLFQIRAFTEHKGWGAWGDILRTRTGRRSESAIIDQESNSGIADATPTNNRTSPSTVIIVVLIVGFVLILVAILFVFFRRKKNGRTPSDLDALEYDKHTGNITPDYNHMQFHSNTTLSRKITAPLVPHFVNPSMNGYKPYVDPTAYEDPNQALKEFAGELDASYVIIEEIIGGGEFGEVCKGKLNVPGRPEETVAIKTLKPGSTDKAKSDFLAEASIMGQFDHQNVIKLKGVVTRSEPVMIITEYMENRSLDSFLKAHDGKLDPLQLTSMLSGIASGMKYLSDKGYVHRDLAARNVLVDGSLNCKIADFGLSRGLEGLEEQVYTTKGGKIPVRWTAPEAIAYRKFTSASDVWSFGVMMWEVLSFGERPYWEWTNQEVIQQIDNGYRLPPPMDCPPAIYQLMEQCWQPDRLQRPSFSDILSILWGFLRCPDLLFNTNTNSTISTPVGPQSQSAVSLTSLNNTTTAASLMNNYPRNGTSTTIYPSAKQNCSTNPSSLMLQSGQASPVPLDELLARMGLSHLYRFLYERGIVTVSVLGRLTMVDLMSHGLSPEDSQRLIDAAQKARMASMPRRAPNRTDGAGGQMARNANCGYHATAGNGRQNQHQGFFV